MVSTLQRPGIDGLRHADALRDSIRLTQTFYRMYRSGQRMITPEEIIAVLNDAGVKFVLMGTYGVGGWRSEPRATDDVDFLIQKSSHTRAIEAIQKAFPTLKMLDQTVVTRFVDPTTKRVVIDLMKPYEAIYRAVFKNAVPAGHTHRIPDLEMALVTKFAAMISSNRPAKKRQIDAGDFSDIVQENAGIIDMAKLRRLANLVSKGAAKKITEFIEDAKAGRILRLEG
ncbi:MAG: hypothetical protein HY040_13135 [Planctomycetes bacterium]|nr:hypothetical protein [Planctomycetota bacterium]